MEKKVARFIGVARRTGKLMTFWILPVSCHALASRSVSPISDDELATEGVKKLIAELDTGIETKMGDKFKNNDLDPKLDPPTGAPTDLLIDDDCDNQYWCPIESEGTQPEADSFTSDTLDQYLSAQVLVPVAGELVRGKVIARKRDHNGNPIGVRHSNSIFDTRQYEVELPNGEINTYTANLIAEYMYSQLDEQERDLILLHEITYHSKNGDALTIDDGFYTSSNGQRGLKMTTKGRASNWMPQRT